MSESAEPASEAAEVNESEEQARVAEDQQEQQEQQQEPQQQQTATVEADDAENEAEATGEQSADVKNEEVAQEVGEQEQVRAQEEEPNDEPALDREESQPKQEEEEQNNEEKQEKPLEDSEDTMQLPVMDTSQGAIEDEEMPSMVTVSSISRIDESETNVKHEEERRLVEEESISQPNPAKDNDDSDDSVCVIDDDDDEDGGNERDVEFEEDEGGSSYTEDDDDEDEDESDESDPCRSDNYEKRVREAIRREEEEEDDEEDDVPEDGEDSDNYEVEHFDGGSDNFDLMYSNGLTKDSKERSASLQNIHVTNTMKVNVNPYSQKARMERNQSNTDNRVNRGKPFAHVQSKVKKYIEDLSEQRRLSTENRKKVQEEARYRHQQHVNEQQIYRNDDIVVTSKTIKDYTEKGLQEVAECEEESEGMYQLPQSLENGEISIFPRHSIGNGEKLTRPDDDGMDVDPIDVEAVRHDDKIDRINGAVVTEERKGILRLEENSKSVMNGEGPSSTVSNLRTLTYEEYMKGPVGKGASEEIIEEDDEEMQEALTPPVYNDNSSNVLQIDNVTSIYRSEQQIDTNFHDQKTPPRMVNQATETPKLHDPEVNSLRVQLQNRNTQFESLRDAYQKTVSENMAMKVELDNLRKMVSYLQEQNKPVPETKTTAIQTDAPAVPRNMPTLEIDGEIPTDPRLATTSINSAMSSQWTDSIGSALLSMEPPPNVTNALNSDESNNQTSKTPSKQKNAFSRAFMTSSRILQTLSNITHGRTKLGRQTKERARKLSASEKEPSPSVGPSNPKKRKATDTMELSSSSQPFKIPHREHQNPSNMQEPETVELDDEEAQSTAEAENPGEIDLQQMVINSDDVKVFVYPEDETGQEHSFLIQAREITNNAKPGVRECGPYLLGNVEVYMTEMNGTINIWGKEVNQSSAASQIADEMETSTRSKDLKSGLRWQSTPRIFNEGSASTSKKSRVIPRFTQQQKQHLHEVHNTMVDCDGCHSHGQRLSWPSCSHESQRACHPSIRVDDLHCGCGNHRNTSGSCCRTNRFVEQRRYSVNDACQTHSPCCYHGGHQPHVRNPVQPETYTSHQPFVRRHSFEPTDDEENAEESPDEENEQYTSKGSHLNEDSSAHSYSNGKVAPPSSNGRRGSGDNSDGSSFINEGDPLLGQRQTSDAEQLQNIKRRPRGKKVRGLLMDLLKGCGDCRTSNPMNKNLQHNASVYAPSTSAQHKIACSPNQPACSLRTGEKCSSCRAGTDKTAEFEAQLENFRSQMDKLRTRSDNLREMLDTLRKDNAN